jgi:glycosyltransferase involved in cell wall biosynthesis/Flp pilus assembly protein TadD
MSLHFLVGPVTAVFAQQNLFEARQRGDCLAFGSDGGTDLIVRPSDTWLSLQQSLPSDWKPDFVALYLPYTTVPPALWSAPVPLVGLAADYNLQWHRYRHCLGQLDLVLSDSAGTEAMRGLGLENVQAANLFGAERGWLEAAADTPRDLDLVFVGNLDAAVQRRRLAWLGRLAQLSERWQVVIGSGVHGDDYRRLLHRARIVFNQSIRGECNRRVFEAAAAGALLLQEAGNPEVEAVFQDRQDCVFYNADNLETLVEYYLEHEAERRAIAEAARAKVPEYTFARLWDEQLQRIEAMWPVLVERAARRCANQVQLPWQARLWQALGRNPAGDPRLGHDLAAALVREPNHPGMHGALGMVLAVRALRAKEDVPQAQVLGHFERAAAGAQRNVMAGLNLVEALVAADRQQAAIDEGRRVLAVLQSGEPLSAEVLDAPHYPPLFDLFRVEWERAAWENAGQPSAEASAKRQLLTWRLHTVLGDLTGELAHYFEAAIARPDLPVTRGALGCALARSGKFAEAASHLEEAVAGNPFDAAAARALHGVYTALGDAGRQRRLARQRRLLAQAAPADVPKEGWFADAPPAGDELASIIILCCNQLNYTRECLESVLEYTRQPYELVLIDNGSNDGTGEYLAELQRRSGPVRVMVIRNETNRGFAGGCNQGLAQARGGYLVLLNNDAIVTSGWLDGLVAWSLHEWPSVGLVGPMTSWAAPPQQIPIDYRSPQELQAFALKRRQAFAGQAVKVQRLLGFCLLFRREVWEKLGGLDEGFGLGFFEDDDLCVRVREAGLGLVMALNVFVHHYGNRTFKGLGLDAHAMLETNFQKFRAKWGDERCVGYRLAEDTGGAGSGALAGPAEACTRMTVSLCMIVKNEEKHLGTCLASVADLVDEMIVVDTGSTDRTKEIALEAGAKVQDFTWVDSFAAARNASLQPATGQWIFWLDADERLDEANRQRLKELFGKLRDENLAYVMRQFSKLEAPTHAAAQVDQVRLFRNRPDIRWQYRVHEQILLAVRRSGGDVRFTGIVIDHAGFCEPEVQGPKVDRNLRLLELELGEHPDDSFVLYNLGAVKLTQGKTGEALELLRKSLAHAQPGDVLIRKLHALVTRAHADLGQTNEALTACRRGLVAYPDDGELLFCQAILLRQQNDLEGTVASLLSILQARPAEHFTSVDAGLYGYRTRSFLAETYRDQGRLLEAEAQWQAVVAECPAFTSAWLELTRLYFQQNRWTELFDSLPQVESDPQTALEGLLLGGRAHLARRDFEAARAVLEKAISQAPQALLPRVLLSHVLLQEGKDWAAAERALFDVLALEPGDREAQHNLLLLRQQQGTQHGPIPAGVGAPLVVSGLAPKVSLCMIVRNEEGNMADCLRSVSDLVDEMIVVDTGSTDRTKDVAQRHGAKVFDFPWIDHFAAARNESLRHATGQWIFWLDADDRVDEENRTRLRALLAGLEDENAAYVMKCLCLPDASGVSTVVDHLRLFRNHPEVRWTFRVHEQILPALRGRKADVRWSDVVIHHTGYQNQALRGKKLERDLRLLQLEQAEQPDHAFTLFNLGSVYQELGKKAEALAMFRRSLEGSAAEDSIVRKLFALIAQCHRDLGQKQEALAACRKGRSMFADDVELLFQEGLALRELGDKAGAIVSWEQCLQTPAGTHFASVNTGLRGYITRHNLAIAYRETGRPGEAEYQWQAALLERPGYEPAWRGLLDSYLAAQRWPEVEDLARQIAAGPHGQLCECVVRGRLGLARKEFAAARQTLETALERNPRTVELRVLLSHVFLQEGRDWPAAQRALCDVLAVEPEHAESRHNLAVLLQQQGYTNNGAVAPLLTLADLYRTACSTPSDINEHLPTLYLLARQCRHVTELGTRIGVSTTAWLFAQPERLICYDKVILPPVERLQALSVRTQFAVHEAHVLQVEIEETDLLFIDTWHVYEQLKAELRRHSDKVRKYIVLHDTTTFGERGETDGHRGVWLAVEEFLRQGKFKLKKKYENNNGLTILEAVQPGGISAVPSAVCIPSMANSLSSSPNSMTSSKSTNRIAAGVVTAHPRVAVISTIHNEEDLILPFLEHYFGLGADAVLLLDNDCTDRTLEMASHFANVTTTRLNTNGVLDCELRRDALEGCRAECAGRFDFVILADADEFLVPKEEGLKETLARHSNESALGTEGYEVIQRPDDHPYDPALPVLRQRRWGVPNPLYNKPIVLRPSCPARLAVGLHVLEGPNPYPPISPFYLFHLASFDERLFLKRRLKMTARQGNRNIEQSYSVQHTDQTEPHLRKRFQAMQNDQRATLLPTGATTAEKKIK